MGARLPISGFSGHQLRSGEGELRFLSQPILECLHHRTLVSYSDFIDISVHIYTHLVQRLSVSSPYPFFIHIQKNLKTTSSPLLTGDLPSFPQLGKSRVAIPFGMGRRRTPTPPWLPWGAIGVGPKSLNLGWEPAVPLSPHTALLLPSRFRERTRPGESEVRSGGRGCPLPWRS